jgi:hypothetical protein
MLKQAMNRAAKWNVAGLVLLLATLPPTPLAAQVPRQHLYEASAAEFLNPERGFYRYADLTNPRNFKQVRDQGQTLVYGRVQASDYRDRPLSQEFLDQIQHGFDEARREGLKVKFRLTYNNGFEPDAPKDVILGHIQQLQPLWERNKDVMFLMDAGFIGAWGEWHSSTNGLDNRTDRKAILFAILDALPKERTVGIRTPHFKREIFSGSQLSDRQVVTKENAFDGSHLARVGHLNDCFLSSASDMGTYALLNNNWPLERELDYLGGESRFVAFGGETCALHDRNEASNALQEMAKLHIDYLNLDYHPEVINRWKEAGSFDEIQRRLGYRFALKSAEFPRELRPGGLMPFRFTLENFGFGELFNPRRVEVALQDETGTRHSAELQVDPRFWSGGETHKIDTWLALPDSLPSGKYSLGLWLPDVAETLREDVRYAVRFANDEVWDAGTGINWLTNDFRISAAAEGSVHDVTQFREVADPAVLQLKGDFDRDGDLDANDIDRLTAGVDGSNLLFDLDRDGVVSFLDREIWVEQLARTRFGDADLNGSVEFADFLLLADAFGTSGKWSDGDFDGNANIGFPDFLLLAANFGDGSQATVSVPAPTSFALAWICIAFSRVLRRGVKSPIAPSIVACPATFDGANGDYVSKR